jgi:aminoglycoside phosphotransferase (APT) family kinase protein
MTSLAGDALPLGSGREADVFALDEHRVLRRYRHGGDTAAEVAVMRHVVGCGFPAPQVYDASGPDLVMQRLHGPTLSHALFTGEVTVASAAVLLADLHRMLHAVPPLRAAGPHDRILHLDLHPDNVMVTAGGPVLIDWRNAAEGVPDLDVALTAVILAEAAVGSHLPAELAPMAQELLTEFIRQAGGDPVGQLDVALGGGGGDGEVEEGGGG